MDRMTLHRLLHRELWFWVVGLTVGHDASNFFVLGGNQSNAVTIARVAKSRLIACRYPLTYPVTTRPLPAMIGNGTISENEA